MTTLDPCNASTRFKKPSQHLLAYYFYIVGVLVAMLAAAVLVTAEAQTQQAQTQTRASETTIKTRYSISDIARAFGFIDANKDGKMSREEAAGFRNIAKYFDAADINQDGNLSIEEFSSALSKP